MAGQLSAPYYGYPGRLDATGKTFEAWISGFCCCWFSRDVKTEGTKKLVAPAQKPSPYGIFGKSSSQKHLCGVTRRK